MIEEKQSERDRMEEGVQRSSLASPLFLSGSPDGARTNLAPSLQEAREKSLLLLQEAESKQLASRERKQKKRKMGVDHLHSIKEKATEVRFVVGLDMSKTSPGMAVFDCRTGACLLLGVSTQKRHLDASLQNKLAEKFSITTKEQHKLSICLRIRPSWSHSSEKETENEEVQDAEDAKLLNTLGLVDYTTDLLMNELVCFLEQQNVDNTKENKCMVVFENYAFNRAQGGQSSAITHLAEICGVMQNKLYRARRSTSLRQQNVSLSLHAVPSTTIKMWFTGSGSATKRAMFQTWQSTVCNQIDLANLIPGSFNVDVPSPHQDLVDAFAMGYFLFCISRSSNATMVSLHPSDKKKKKKKAAHPEPCGTGPASSQIREAACAKKEQPRIATKRKRTTEENYNQKDNQKDKQNMPTTDNNNKQPKKQKK